jgi:hypothetical protein
MPVDVALLGRTLASQASIYGGGSQQLCNAVDMKVGW